MDAYDQAQAHEQRLRDQAVEAAVAKAQPKGEGSKVCYCCQEPIPEARRIAQPKANTCRDCQEDLERAMGR